VTTRPSITHRPLLLGVDTGGTFTDAVLYDDATHQVVAAAKAPTTHHRLAVGIAEAIAAVLQQSGVDPADIALVSLSTTLATNALVEGKGRCVAAVVIGFDDEVLNRAGLGRALGTDPLIHIAGGHDSHGNERMPLPLDQLDAQLDQLPRSVRAVAVTAEFSVRNPAHELAAREHVRARTGLPVTCSSELSARLNGPKRAVTAVLNARLISIIDELLDSTDSSLAELGISAPVMVVRGDGSLVSAAFVRERPIETVLSGPAASIVGAAHLSGLHSAVVSDIGGTTTDVGVLLDGAPRVDPEGATVGGHRTMVSAVAMHTIGLGGDSHVTLSHHAARAGVTLGPRRVVPLCVAAQGHPAVATILGRQLQGDRITELDGVILLVGEHSADDELTDAERQLLDTIPTGAHPASMLAGPAQRRTLDRLVRRGVVRVAAFTPTDAGHVLGTDHTHPAGVAAARSGALLLARQRDHRGRRLVERPAAAAAEMAAAEMPAAELVAATVVATLVRRSAEAVLASAMADDGIPDDAVASAAVQAAIDRRDGRGGSDRSDGERPVTVSRLDVGLSVPLVALGASAGAYYPMVGQLLGSEVVIPEHFAVANAVGAVVGSVRVQRSCVISSPQPGLFLVHGTVEQITSMSLDEAKNMAKSQLCDLLLGDVSTAGGSDLDPDVDLHWRWRETIVTADQAQFFIEGELTGTASTRPTLKKYSRNYFSSVTK
jgi:N-methylhydantoinase A/oxoprolinase/acetone carboxylase beta subunit